jgi:hypothetical protein
MFAGLVLQNPIIIKTGRNFILIAMKSSILFTLLSVCVVLCSAQTNSTADSLNVRFGEVTAADYKVTPPAADSDADAIILADVGTIVIEGYEEGLRSVFTRHRRIMILKSSGMETAKVTVPFSEEDNSASGVRNLKACTYNLAGGQVTRIPLEKKDYFIEKTGEDGREQKFAFPGAKVGSIIEYTYTVRSSNLVRLRSWFFQGKYPVVLSVYTVKIPDIINYVIMPGGRKADTSFTQIGPEDKTVAGNTWFLSHLQTTTWIMRNVSPLRDEPYTSTLDNYYSRLTFQLSFMPVNGHAGVNVLGDWNTATEKLLTYSLFGKLISLKQNWVKAELPVILDKATTSLERARRIFSFIRDKFKADESGIFFSSTSLEDLYKRRRGNRADLNLLLLVLLRAVDIDADPVILSTRDHGIARINYPFMDDYNYVICKASIDGGTYYLDASVPQLGFGRLPSYCYNGPGRVIKKAGDIVYFRPDSLQETKMTTVVLSNENDRISGSYIVQAGYFESLDLRSELTGKTIDKYLSGEHLPAGCSLDPGTAAVDSQYQYEIPLTYRYGFHFGFNGEKHIYFNPMLDAAMKKNPFVPAERSFPVEMDYPTDETYVLTMEVPKGYTVEEMPKSARVSLNNGQGSFEYIVGYSGEQIQMKCRLQLKKAIFDPEDYPPLRDFFAFVVKKENEMVVFKATQ